jgi:transposase
VTDVISSLDPADTHHARSNNCQVKSLLLHLINQLRAVLLERGFTAPQGRRKLEYALTILLDETDEPANVALSLRTRALVKDMRTEWAELDQRIKAYDDEFAALAKAVETTRRLATIPGIGVLNATALSAAIGNGATFARGRDLAAWLGLVPRQATTGGKAKLLGISKRGNKYLRKLLIHGARSAMPSLLATQTPLGAWLRALLTRVHKNAATVALANKLARIAWAVLRRGVAFNPVQLTAA